MEDVVKIFETSEGDIYHITLSEEQSFFSEETIKALNNIVVVGIDLRRLAGNHPTNQKVLTSIAKTIADYFQTNKNTVICYYCDFINRIPRTNKNTMPPQEYRSLLFEKMFQRYVKQQRIDDVRLTVVDVNGINEKYYFHIIHRLKHSELAELMKKDLKEGYEK